MGTDSKTRGKAKIARTPARRASSRKMGQARPAVGAESARSWMSTGALVALASTHGPCPSVTCRSSTIVETASLAHTGRRVPRPAIIVTPAPSTRASLMPSRHRAATRWTAVRPPEPLSFMADTDPVRLVAARARRPSYPPYPRRRRLKCSPNKTHKGGEGATMQCVDGDLNSSAARLFEGFLRRTHLSRPSELANVVAEEVEAALGASDVVLSLANHEQTALVPVPSRRSTSREDQQIEGTFAGRAFSTMELVTAPTAESGRRRVWLPMLDGTDRMGTLELTVPCEGDTVAPELVMVLERYTHAVAQATMAKGLYGDVFERVRRSQPMTVGAELLWSVLPPLTYATEGLVISAMLEPAYDNGGDAFDFAVNDTHAHLAVFDAMGHGLAASGAA